ncbi:trypsin-like peptidase domain-containing protein [Bythopirellula goksoeyrii]|uniref:SLA1 homology domain-containing protein n=1 Tax=Bythopirellula goksoeyrii TaxID=1400387 RepID=A0A5B9QF15_9BACT|nr:trypsin-like peptidase domain-containing protein [Bythopirellula goksoeyrii]QEG36479.1 hypothetical protein Pr1d_37930 [Bythopirellula goksoeyrii]
MPERFPFSYEPIVARILFSSLTCFSIFVSCPVLLSRAEQWTDSSGNHTVEAEFVSFENGTVVLRDNSAKEIKVPYEKFNKASQILVDSLVNRRDEKDLDRKPMLIGGADELESIAKEKRKAVDALELYEVFVNLPQLDEHEKAHAESRIDVWRQRANEELWRWGNRWVPIETIRENIEDEDRLIQEAHRLIEIGNETMARERFEEASKKNPESIRGDFYLGILHALIGKDSKSARECFNKCVKRLESYQDNTSGIQRANLIAALNNRAICYARMGKHSQAMRDWDLAIEMEPMTPELVQNLGYYARLAGLLTNWGVSSNTARRISEQYAAVTVANQSNAFAAGVGWLFIPFIDTPKFSALEEIELPDNENIDQDRMEFVKLAEENEFRIAGWASAVAVDQDYLLTSKDYIKDAYGLWVSDEGNVRKDLPGRIVAVSNDYDLALIRFNGLNARPLSLEKNEIRRADPFRIIGYPEPGLLGSEAQIFNGVVMDINNSRAAHDQGYVTRLVYDSPLNRGCVGAPLLNDQGRIIGIDVGESDLAQIAGGRRCGISSGNIRSFLSTTSREYAALEQGDPNGIVDIQEANLDSSVFQIALVCRAPRLSWSERISKIRGVTSKQGWNAFEDPWCAICNGIGELPCRGRGCNGGQVAHREQVVVGRFPATGKPILDWKRTFEKCDVCRGKGSLDCPHCSGKEHEPLLSIRDHN